LGIDALLPFNVHANVSQLLLATSGPPKSMLKGNLIMSQLISQGAWDYFDSVDQGNPPICGARGTLFIFDTHFFKYKESLGGGSKF